LISRENYYPLHHSIDETAGIKEYRGECTISAEKDALSATEAAQFFGLSLKMMRRQAHNGVIPAKKRGRRCFFHRAELKK
jgi:excisionase family DNA binding protein